MSREWYFVNMIAQNLNVFLHALRWCPSSRNIILTQKAQKAQKTQKASRYALAGRPDGDIRAIAMYESAWDRKALREKEPVSSVQSVDKNKRGRTIKYDLLFCNR